MSASTIRSVQQLADPLRQQVGAFLRTKVAGPDADERAQRIWHSAGERWYKPSDPIWKVNGDPSMYAGGVCALFLQSLHPGPMAAVAQFDDYQADPWGRLQRISNFIAVSTYAPIPDAEQVFAVVRAVHDRVQGTDELGNPYDANDPRLLRWVHDAETWSFLTSYQRWGRGHLSPADADEYVRQASEGGYRLGATDLPETVAQLEGQLTDFRSELATTQDALDVVEFLTHRAPLPAVAKPGYRMVVAGGKALLPGWARGMLHLPNDRLTVARQEALGVAATKLVGWALPGDTDPQH